MDQSNQELNEKLDDLIAAGMNITNSWSGLWSDSLRWFFSDQISHKKARKNWDWVVLNYIWPSAMAEVSKLARYHPQIVGEPWEPTDQEAADVWIGNIRWLWQKGINKHGMMLEHLGAILDKKLYGYCVSKFYWEPKARWDPGKKRWEGSVRHKLWHPAFFWTDPAAETIDECRSIGTQRWVELDWAISRWPKHAKKLRDSATRYKDLPAGPHGGPHIRAAKTTSVYVSAQGGTDPGTSLYKPTRLLSHILRQDKTSTTLDFRSDKEYIKLEEIYFEDLEETKVKDQRPVAAQDLVASGRLINVDGRYIDPVTTEPLSPEQWPIETVREYSEPKYPNGRMVLRACGEIILRNEPWRYYEWPFVVSQHYLLPHMWQGSDAVQLYQSTQDMINVSVSHLFNNMKLYGDPKVMMETGAVARNPRTKEYYKVGAGAGSVIRLARNALNRGSFRFADPPNISAGALSLYGLFVQEFKNITGLQSIAKGEREPGRKTATEANWLALSSQDRIKLQAMLDDEWVRRSCELIAQIIQANYDLDQMVRIVGDDGVTGAQQILQGAKSVRFDISIVPRSMLPYDQDKKIQKLIMADNLLKQPVASPLLPSILRELDVPNVKGILKAVPAFQKWLRFLQVYQATAEGRIDAGQATQIVTRQIMGGLPTVPEKESQNAT
ncbi:MAG: hypothetical protein AMJ75_00400 [Phycisphaerae bacterium SM1_79]|nr:MAG: hypothetical protein AMJ75_00400 [Phycisphaerae bacterium SM1_79]